MSWVLWLTGPPACGKTTLSAAVRRMAAPKGVRFVVLESDAMRRVLTPRPTFEPSERERFYGQLVDLAALIALQGFPVLIDATASRRAFREKARREIDRFLEVTVRVPLEIREARDPKGLYRRAREGTAPNLPGAGLLEPYEESPDSDLFVSGETSPDINAALVLKLAKERGYL